MSQAKLREALAGGAPTKEKGPPVADGVISETPDTPEAIEWRTKQSVIDSIASSSTYLDPEDEGSPPSSVYGKFTWHIDNFSDTSKRELRSGVFQVGPYRWYVLVYPQGCDVSNHLSLFLCVADYDKLLPGWGHYAQFTIAVVNKDPKKSKYSDTLHRFCKKEHDWGWKKFMELGKISDGFTLNDTLVIKAQVQVIPDRPVRPFQTLECQYRRELVRVYLTNVEGIVRRYVEEKREVISRVLSGPGFIQFWEEQSETSRAKLASAPAAPLLKSLVKKFFNEKEVTSTLVMDALYCGAKLLERAGRVALHGKESNSNDNNGALVDDDEKQIKETSSSSSPAEPSPDASSSTTTSPTDAKEKEAKACDERTIATTTDPTSLIPGLVINTSTDRMFFAGDLIAALRRMVNDPVPTFNADTKPTSDALALRNAQDVDDQSKGSVERDERRLADLGRRTVEMFGAAHIVEAQLEAAWAEAETIKRQEELIREVEEASRGEAERAAAKAESEKEKKARKKERQRAKKEAEKAKKEAEEAEKQRQEEDRKAQVEKLRQEAEEKRKKEEAENEAEKVRVRQVAEAKRQAELAAKAAAKAAAKKQQQQQQQQQATSATSAAVAPATNSVTSRAASDSSLSSNTEEVISSVAPAIPASSDLAGTPSLRDAVSLSKDGLGSLGGGSGGVSGVDRTPDLSLAPPRAPTASTIPAQTSIDASPTTTPHDLNATTTATTNSLVDALRAEIHRLTLIVKGKDDEILGLRTRVSELETHFITSRPGSSLSQASPEVSSAGLPAVGKVGGNNNNKHSNENGNAAASSVRQQHVVYTAATGSNTSGSNPSDAILATASMMPGAPPPGMVRPSVGNGGNGNGGGGGRPVSANAQFAPVPPGMGPYSKLAGTGGNANLRANGNSGANGGSGHSSSEGMPSQHSNAAAAAGLLNGANGGRMYQQPGVPAQGARAFSSPLPNTKRSVGVGGDGMAPGLESPGLDDFAHIGLINDLLE